jgi:hypothetical protein
MSLLDVYHVGNANDVATVVQSGQGLPWSQAAFNWLGSGIYFWEDPSWAELWWLRRWSKSTDEPSGSILMGQVESTHLLDLTNRNDARLFFDAAKPALQLLSSRANSPRNDRNQQKFYLDCAVVNAVQAQFWLAGKVGLRMPFYLGDSVTEEGNFYVDQHLQICLWDLNALENPRQLQVPDRLSLTEP